MQIKIIKKFNVLNFMLLLLTSTCSFMFETLKPFQPFFYFYIIALLFYIFCVIKSKKLCASLSQKMCLVCIAYWIVVMFIIGKFLLPNLNVAMSLSYYFIATNLFILCDKNTVEKCTSAFLFCSLFYITIETILRIKSVGFISLFFFSFYAYKYNSFMCMDSNFVGVITLVLSIFSFYMYNFVSKRIFYYISTIYAIILAFCTFSRASILSAIIGIILMNSYLFLKKHLFVYLNQYKKLTVKLLLFLFFIIPTLLILSIKIIMLLLSDGSFLTKIDLFTDSIKYIKEVSIKDLLFGIGNEIELIKLYFDRATHNLPTTYIVSYGIFGFLLILSFWASIIKDAKWKPLFILIPFFINGFSLTFPSCPPFYIAFAFIYYFEYILPMQNTRKEIQCH